MTKIEIAINRILAKRDDRALMIERRKELSKMVDEQGLEAVVTATGLKESTINQYLRDSNARISLAVIDQARFVFTHPDYLAAKNNRV